MNLLSDFTIFTQDVIDKTFEISDKAEEHIHINKASTMKWGCIKNFYKDPVAVKEFLQKFPVVTQNATQSPGLQQHFPMPAMTALSKVYDYLYGILSKYRYPINARVSLDNTQSYSDWQTYCNTHWKHMDISAVSMIPHVDPFNYAFNIWLTDDNPAGTEFYYHQTNSEHPAAYTQSKITGPGTTARACSINGNYLPAISGNWDPDKIDTFFVERGWHRYLTIEPEYNSCTFYPSLFFHKPEWDSRNYKEDLLRYSQVISYRAFHPQGFETVWDNYKKSEEYNIQ